MTALASLLRAALAATIAAVMFAGMLWIGVRFFPAGPGYQYRRCQTHHWGPADMCDQFRTATTVEGVPL